MKVLVIGTGAIGSFYGSLLARTGADVSVMARSDYLTIKQHGIEIHSDTELGHYVFQPVEVLHEGEHLREPADYVLLCIKMVDGADPVSLLKNVVGPHTAIVLIANGIGIEQAIAKAFPHNTLISGLAFICVSRMAPGKIWHQSYGRLTLGDFPGGTSDQTCHLAEAFRQAGISCQATADIAAARWQKCVWNAAFNPLSVLSGGLDTASILKTQNAFVRAIMQEVCAIAAALKHPQAHDIVDKMIANTQNMPPYKTSMLLDFEAGRPMEIESILGNAVRAGQKAGVAIPHLESLYALMKLREMQQNTAHAG